MIEKIREYLTSGDIEMVILGALLLEQNVPCSEWRHHLDNAQLGMLRWTYSATPAGITIVPIDHTRERRTKIVTGIGGKKMFEEAMKKRLLNDR